MRPIGPRLDKHGFPIPPDFDAAGVDDPGRRPPLYGPWLRSMLKVAIVAGILSALWVHFDLGTKARDVLGQYHAQQAVTQAMRGDLDQALNHIDQALSWDPDSVAFLVLRARIKAMRHDYEGCLADAESALDIKPNDQKAQSLRLHCLHHLHRQRDAAAAATEMLNRSLGSRAEALNTRAYSRALGDFELNEALADIDEALSSSPNDASYLDTRGYVLFKLGQHKEALADFERAIKLTEKQRDEFERAGRGRRLIGEQAALQADQQERFDHNLAVMYHHRGEVHEKLGDAEQARKDLFIGQQMGFDPAAGVY